MNLLCNARRGKTNQVDLLDIFLKSQFVVFSQINSTPQLGFAAQNLLVDDDEDELEYYECADGESD